MPRSTHGQQRTTLSIGQVISRVLGVERALGHFLHSRHSSDDDDENGPNLGYVGDLVLPEWMDATSDPDRVDDGSSTDEELEDPPMDSSPSPNNAGVDRAKHSDLFSSKTPSFLSYLKDRELGRTPRPSSITSHFIPVHKQTLTKLESKCFCGTYTRGGDLFVSAAQDGFIRVYDTSKANFTHLRSIPCEDIGWSIIDTDISPDGKNIIYSTWSEALRMTSLDSGDHHEALPLVPESDVSIGIFCVRFSPNGKEVVAGSNHFNVHVFDLESGRSAFKFRAHDHEVNAVAFTDSTANIIVSGGDDEILRVWDRRTLSEAKPKPVGIFYGHYDGVTYIDSRGDGHYFISNSKDQTIKLWDLRCFSRKSGSNHARAMTFRTHWDYRWQAIPSVLKNCREKMQGDTSVMTYKGHQVRQTLIRSRFSPSATTSQSFIYSGCASGSVVIYDILTGRVITRLRGHTQVCRDVSWHPYFPEMISSSWDGSICRWNYCDRMGEKRPRRSFEHMLCKEEDEDEEFLSSRSRRYLRRRHLSSLELDPDFLEEIDMQPVVARQIE